jgi:hypothetical protein
MAGPAKKYEEAHGERDPRRLVEDPANPLPPIGADPLTPDPRYAANDRERIETRIIETNRGSGTAVLIGAVVIVLAIIAYFAFANRTANTPAAPEQPAATEPAAPDASAPGTTATPPADTQAPAGQDTAPATQDAAPADQAPAQPESSQPEPSAEPAPAPAPAQ